MKRNNYFKSYDKETVSFFAKFAIFGALFFGVTTFVQIYASSVKCSDLGLLTGNKTNFSLLSGCYIERDGKFLPVDVWKRQHEVYLKESNEK